MKQQHILTVALVALSASPALAGGMPQIDQVQSFPGQLAWLAISFALLYALVAGFIAPRVRSVLTARSTTIQDAIATAERLKAEAASTRGDFEAAGAEARAKAAALIAEAQATAAKEASTAQAALAAELEASAAKARDAIAKAVANATMEVDDAAQSLAVAMTEKLLGTPSVTAKKKAS